MRVSVVVMMLGAAFVGGCVQGDAAEPEEVGAATAALWVNAPNPPHGLVDEAVVIDAAVVIDEAAVVDKPMAAVGALR